MRTLRDRADDADEEGFKSYIETDRLVLAGWIAYAQGDAESAVAAMREAGDVEASVQKHPVTPGTLYPPYEALGDLLLSARASGGCAREALNKTGVVSWYETTGEL